MTMHTFMVYALIFMTITAASSGTVFMLFYAQRAWHTSVTGRIIMLMAGGITLRAWVGVVNRVDQLTPHYAIFDLIAPFIVLSWAIVAGVFAWCTHVLRLDYRRGDVGLATIHQIENQENVMTDANEPIMASPMPGEDVADIDGPDETDVTTAPIVDFGDDQDDQDEQGQNA